MLYFYYSSQSLVTEKRLRYVRAMKIYKIAIVILGLMVAGTAESAPSSYYYSTGIGSGKGADGQNLTIEIGNRRVMVGKRHFLVGVDLPFIDYGSGDIPPETINSPCPHSNYTSLGKKSEGIETGLLGKFGLEQFRPNFYTSVIGGISHVHEVHLSQSNSTRQYYEQSSESKFFGVLGISIGYFPELFAWKAKLNFQVDYDNRRGITCYIGWGW